MRIPSFRQFLQLLALPLLALAAITGSAAPSKSLDEAMSHDGLVRIKVKGVDLAYAKPGATLAAYKRVRIDPVEVAFSKSWDPNKTGSGLKLSAADRENIRTGVATLVQEEFAREIAKDSGYQLTDETGEDVLRVRINVVNLYVAAPDSGSSAGRSRTYVVSPGEMTLFAELIDSETGAVIARVVDRREAQSSGVMMLSSGVENRGRARDIAAGWARVLRKALDNAHGIAVKR